ncbi:MAG: MBL fold metallo-hydrolase [Candidatus Brocadiia bacterium]
MSPPGPAHPQARPPGGTVEVHALAVGPLQACCYILAPQGSADAAVIDPGGDAELIARQLRYRELAPRLLLLTHGHIDHTGATAALKEAFPDAQTCIHEADALMLGDAQASLAALVGLPFQPCRADRLLAHGDELVLGPLTIEVLHTPGHTPGGVSLLVRASEGPAVVFSGDTLFAGGLGRTDFPGGSMPQLLGSIRERLLVLPDDTVVYPGHGEATTVGEERRTNPFLRGAGR